MVQECFCLFRRYAFFSIGRHMGRLLDFLTLQYGVEVLFVRQRCIEFFLCLRSMAHLTFGFVISCGVRWLCFTLSGCNAQKDHAEQEDSYNRYCYVLNYFHHSSLSTVRSPVLSATPVPCGKSRKTRIVGLSPAAAASICARQCETFLSLCSRSKHFASH